MRRINSRLSSFPALFVLLGAVLLVATFHSAPGHMSAATPRPASTPAAGMQFVTGEGESLSLPAANLGFPLLSTWGRYQKFER